MIIEKISSEEWKNTYMKSMYEEVFGAERPVGLEKCDYVLIAKDSELDPVGFITCHEMDSETVYWQFGGAAKKVKNTNHVLNHYIHFLAWSLAKYKRVTTRIENTNSSMLRMAIRCGFLVYGIWNFKNKIYLELCFEGRGV